MQKGHAPFIGSVLVAIGSDTTSRRAFAHALAIALVNRSGLTLFHPQTSTSAQIRKYPAVRQALESWRRLAPNSDRSAVLEQLAVQVRKTKARGEYGRAFRNTIANTHPDLVVLASEAHELLVPRSRPSGLSRLRRPFVRESVRESNAVVLYVPSEGRGFVEPVDGYLSLRRILIPATEGSRFAAALAMAISIAESLGDPPVTIEILGGDEKAQIPTLRESKAWTIETSARRGNSIDEILSAARGVELVVLPAAGNDGVLRSRNEADTEQIVRAAPCPVLVVPMA